MAPPRKKSDEKKPEKNNGRRTNQSSSQAQATTSRPPRRANPRTPPTPPPPPPPRSPSPERPFFDPGRWRRRRTDGGLNQVTPRAPGGLSGDSDIPQLSPPALFTTPPGFSTPGFESFFRTPRPQDGLFEWNDDASPVERASQRNSNSGSACRLPAYVSPPSPSSRNSRGPSMLNPARLRSSFRTGTPAQQRFGYNAASDEGKKRGRSESDSEDDKPKANELKKLKLSTANIGATNENDSGESPLRSGSTPPTTPSDSNDAATSAAPSPAPSTPSTESSGGPDGDSQRDEGALATQDAGLPHHQEMVFPSGVQDAESLPTRRQGAGSLNADEAESESSQPLGGETTHDTEGQVTTTEVETRSNEEEHTVSNVTSELTGRSNETNHQGPSSTTTTAPANQTNDDSHSNSRNNGSGNDVLEDPIVRTLICLLSTDAQLAWMDASIQPRLGKEDQHTLGQLLVRRNLVLQGIRRRGETPANAQRPAQPSPSQGFTPRALPAQVETSTGTFEGVVREPAQHESNILHPASRESSAFNARHNSSSNRSIHHLPAHAQREFHSANDRQPHPPQYAPNAQGYSRAPVPAYSPHDPQSSFQVNSHSTSGSVNGPSSTHNVSTSSLSQQRGMQIQGWDHSYPQLYQNQNHGVNGASAGSSATIQNVVLPSAPSSTAQQPPSANYPPSPAQPTPEQPFSWLIPSEFTFKPRSTPSVTRKPKGTHRPKSRSQEAPPPVVSNPGLPLEDKTHIWCGHTKSSEEPDPDIGEYITTRCTTLLLRDKNAIEEHYKSCHGTKCNWVASCPRSFGIVGNTSRHIWGMHVLGTDRRCEGKRCINSQAAGSDWCALATCTRIAPIPANDHPGI
ncbi:hypothetical protein NMY22_g3077 [Coprinellus aureogranulatus]|nr:hypothetical protein NMY22_g3077 [Coprinellus aureogranulatus]